MIDTHAHLQMPDFAADWPAVVKRIEDAGLEYAVVVGFDIESSKRAIALAEQNERILAVVGVHPHDASTLDSASLDELRHMATHQKVVAVGETGLDYYRNLSPHDRQTSAFESQLELAVEMNLPVVIHDREAHEEVADVLERFSKRLVGGVLHCFSGDINLAERALEWGFFLAVGGTLTYPNAGNLRGVIKQVPTERLVLETDAPYLSPQPRRGKRNEPAYVHFVAEELARLKGLSTADIDRITSLNARQLFGLPSRENGQVVVYPIRDSLYVNVTGACTNECTFCTRFKSSYVKGHNLLLKRDPSVEEMLSALDAQPLKAYKEVVFCGLGEPLLRLEVVKQVAAHLKEKGCLVRVNTNGQANLIYGRNIVPELHGLVDSISISLNSSNAERYYDLCKPKFGRDTFQSILEFIRECKKFIPRVSVTALDMDADELDACKHLAQQELGVEFRERHYNEVG